MNRPLGKADKPARRNERDTLVQALQQDAVWQSELEQRRRKQGPQRAAANERVTFVWETESGAEAEFHVWIHSSDEQISAVQLVRLDFRAPTAREQLEFEDEFQTHLQECGQLWADVMSHSWERRQ